LSQGELKDGHCGAEDAVLHVFLLPDWPARGLGRA
jgi:hypothetical protein